MALERMRGRLPLIVFFLLLVVCLVLIGFACACLSDQPLASIERALSGLAQLSAVVEVWPLVVVSLFAAAAGWVALEARPRGRASPALLQRFLL